MAEPVDFFAESLRLHREAAAHIAETGGLEEITEAASGLKAVIDLTRAEIAEATFASRFMRVAGDTLRTAIEEGDLSPTTTFMVNEEGECGLKRAQLQAGLRTIESDVASTIARLVELRADLKFSQQEF